MCVHRTVHNVALAHNIAQNRPDSFPPNPPDNVDAQCDKLATKLTLRVENRQFSATVPAFNNLLHLHLAPPLGVTPFEFWWVFFIRELESHGLSCGVVCAILRLTVSVEHRLVTDKRTDRRTDRRRQLIPALAWRRVGKNCFTSKLKSKSLVQWSLNNPPHLKHAATLPCALSLTTMHVSDCC